MLWKHYDNAVDVVVRLHNPTDPSTERTTPPSSAHVQLDDDPQTPIQQSVGDKFRQHDGMLTMMMLYRRRASPKLRDDMTEVEYGGGGHRTWLKDQINCCVSKGCPLPIYKGVEEGEGRPSLWRALGGVLLPPGVGFPPSK